MFLALDTGQIRNQYCNYRIILRVGSYSVSSVRKFNEDKYLTILTTFLINTYHFLELPKFSGRVTLLADDFSAVLFFLLFIKS